MKKQDPTITGPTAWQGGGTNSGQSTMTINASGLTLNAIDQLLVGFYKLSSEDLKALSTKLKNAGINCIASTTKRNVIEKDGAKVSRFEFVKFRDY